ncbi:uncharacterized protein LOC142166919 [Nicotiana tabacum]|uniref:Uncharacterized protein LOC142166919 n=1 Tax=Nicotiana tabacum TaxID=4097 RepID=A0AC58SD48_TOBAC
MKIKKLIQFLMGLNGGYSEVRGNILMMKPLPSTAQAYSIILHEESQKEVHSGHHVSVKPSAFNVNAQKTNMSIGVEIITVTLKQGKTTFALTANAAVEEVETSGEGAVITRGVAPSLMNPQRFTKEQYEQLIQMIQSVQAGNISTSGSDANASANFVGKCTAFHTFISCFTTIISKFWIIDSGASQHMTHDKTLLNNFKQLPFPIQVTLQNSYKVKVYSLGSVLISPELELHNVLYIPSSNNNHLSVNQLYKQLNSNVLFTKSECLVQPPSLKSSVPESIQTFVRGIFPYNESLEMNKTAVSDSMNSNRLWHLRLGHLTYHAMKNIKNISLSSTDKQELFLYHLSSPKGKDCPIITLSTSRVESAPADGLHRSSREHNTHKYLSHYICDASYSVISPNLPFTPFHSYSFSALSQPNQQFVNSIWQIFEPNSYQEAAIHPGWQAAMAKELEALESNCTWEVVQIPF